MGNVEAVEERHGGYWNSSDDEGVGANSKVGREGRIALRELTDGSTVRGIQLVIKNDGSVAGSKSVEECGGAGASISVKGEVVASIARGKPSGCQSKGHCAGVVAEPKLTPWPRRLTAWSIFMILLT